MILHMLTQVAGVQLELYAISSAVEKRNSLSFLASNASTPGRYEQTRWVNPNATINVGNLSYRYANATARMKHKRAVRRNMHLFEVGR